VRRSGAAWVTDHLAWGSEGGVTTHDLLPVPYTRDVARACAEQIRIIQDTLEVPFSVENISSYLEFRSSTMTEWEFLNEVVEQADCGILLDVNNVYVSSVNHGFNPVEYLEAVPHHRVAQMHLAGHAVVPEGIIDTHDQPVAQTVWELFALAVERCGPTPTLLEWDARLPAFDVVHAEAKKAKRYAPSEGLRHVG
jgi:uncharacterized protein (UPF0276 family)